MRMHFLLAIALLSYSATAQQAMVRVSSGTGFFINRDGDVITNAHVVPPGCQSIRVHTPLGDRVAKLRARDETRDLAVLYVAGAVAETAPLRWNIRDLKIGDAVIVMGYPGQEGVANRSTFRKSTVTGLSGPKGEPTLLQLGNVLEHGNSGGPVLDSAGNVIAVAQGMSKTYRLKAGQTTPPTPDQLVAESSIAIPLAALKDFLHTHSISYNQAASGLVAYSDDALDAKARGFVVPVKCVLGVAG